MTPERYAQVNSLVDELLDTPADDRASFLDRACADDAALRKEVEAVLDAHESERDFLQTSALELIAKDMASEPQPHELSGRVLGDYEILSRLGAGGIGEVWLARDRRLARVFALKVLSAKFAGNPQQVLRFQHEARAASQLNHPNIVAIYEIGKSEGLDFIAEEFVDGMTIRQQLAAGPMPLGFILDAGAQVAAALAAAHKIGIIHRDIKPENLMTRTDGLVKILDFGLARFVEHMAEMNSLLVAGQSLTVPGLVLGTVRYMSPEQARGLPLDQRSDIFSLGVVLFEMATATPPFSGPTAADTLTSILTDDPPPIAQYAPNLPAEFERVLLRCMEKDRETRYASAEDLRSELDTLASRIAASEALLPVSATPRKKVVSPIRKYPGTLLLTFAAMLLVVLAAMFTFRGRRDERSTASFASMKISRLMLRGPVSDAAIAPDGKELAYVRNEGPGESIWLTNLGSSGEERRIAPEAGGHSGLTFSPDDRYLYYRRTLGTEDGTLYRVALGATGEPSKVLDGVRGAVAFSWDGQELAFIRLDPSRLETVLMVATADGRSERKVAACRRPQYFSPLGLAWSFDKGSIVCFAGQAKHISSRAFELEQVQVADGRRRRISAKTWEWAGSVVWPAKTDTLVVSGSDVAREDPFQIWKISLKDGAYSKVTNDLNSYGGLNLTSDGKILSATQTERSASLWVQSAQKNAEPAQISAGEIYGLESVAWLPGDQIVYTAVTGDYRNLWLTDPSGSNSTQLTFGPGDKSEVSATRDGRYLLYQSRGKIWRVNADGRDARQLTTGSHDVHPTASADGQYVIYTSFVGWSPAIGAKPSLWRVPIGGGKAVQLSNQSLSFPQVSPDGKWIACIYYPEGDPRFSRREIAVLSADGSSFEVLDHMPQVDGDFSWTPDGRGIIFTRMLHGADNVWQQLLKGGTAVPVTHFVTDTIFSFRSSIDGKRLAMVRGKQVSDVVLIRDF